MKTIKLFIILQLCFVYPIVAQNNVIEPDLSKVNNTDFWTLFNRALIPDDIVHLNGQSGDGLLYYNNTKFSNGRIEVEIKGKDEQGKSFVGLAFHGLNDSIYDAIYFRPFNFKNPDRKGHSAQYISHPEYTWFKLRNEFPDKYENIVSPVPEPNEWFQVTIVINYPVVKVYVNNSEKTSLMIELLSNRKEGWVGFWVGNNSEGYFRNLKIIPE